MADKPLISHIGSDISGSVLYVVLCHLITRVVIIEQGQFDVLNPNRDQVQASLTQELIMSEVPSPKIYVVQ